MYRGAFLRDLLKRVQSQLEQLPAEDLKHKEHPEKWSKLEILGHLVDSAYNNHQRFLRAEEQGNLIFFGYNQNEWARLNNYQKRTTQEVINLWYTVNVHLSYLIDEIQEDFFIKEMTTHNFHQIGMRTVEEGSPSSLAYLYEDYLFHLEHHLAQIVPSFERSIA